MAATKHIFVGVVIIVITGFGTVLARDHIMTSKNTDYRIEQHRYHDEVKRDLAEIKTTLKFLVKKYDKSP